MGMEDGGRGYLNQLGQPLCLELLPLNVGLHLHCVGVPLVSGAGEGPLHDAIRASHSASYLDDDAASVNEARAGDDGLH